MPLSCAGATVRRHSTTTRRSVRNMAITQILYVICHAAILVSFSFAEPDARRIPKVYNALITSNQNLEPSKAFPVYQPVLTNAAIPFPYQPIFYGDFPLSNNLLPAPAFLPNPAIPNVAPPSSANAPKDSGSADKTDSPATNAPNTDADKPTAEASTSPPPPPPNTESPIPLNQFGLPPQILPIGRIPTDFDFPHYNPFPYAYPNYRFYDPSLQFGYQPYSPWPVYPALSNFVAQYAPTAFGGEVAPATAAPNGQSTKAPPAEPNDLNVLNYSSKDPAIPNVPPPPLPQGGLKADTK